MSEYFDAIELRVECEVMIDDRAKTLSKYFGMKEEDIDPRYDQIYRAVVCNNKVTEEDESEIAVMPKRYHHYGIHERYELGKNAQKAKAKIAVIKAKRSRKFENDPRTWVIEYGNGNLVYIPEGKLWKNKGRSRREGKAICRDALCEY